MPRAGLDDTLDMHYELDDYVLLTHPAVKQAYVVGVPDRDKGEVVVAAVELRDGVTATAEALVTFCREHLASYKIPTRVVFMKATSFRERRRGRCRSGSSGRS